MRRGLICGLFPAALLLGACASLPKEIPKTESHVFEGTGSTFIGRFVEARLAEVPDENAFRLLPDGEV